MIPEGFRALSVRVNDVVGVAGYVLPGTRVDVVTTLNPTNRPEDVASKVILTNVQVLAAGTKIEQNGKDNKPVQVSVVTLMVNPDEAERLTLASTEGKIQLALRNPLDKTAPATERHQAQHADRRRPRCRPARSCRSGAALAPAARARSRPPQPVAASPALPTVEIIRGDKRATRSREPGVVTMQIIRPAARAVCPPLASRSSSSPCSAAPCCTRSSPSRS